MEAPLFQVDAFTDRPFTSKKQAETWVLNWLKERERDFLILSGRVVGIETLRPRQIHQFAGLGTRLDGFYRFTQVKHVQAPGQIYAVDFVANKVLSQEITRRPATTKATNNSAVKGRLPQKDPWWFKVYG